ncbi:hypothetical protein BST61_g255 [Cercospora zeina]
MPPLTALAISLPITPSTIASHPALQFYAIYGQNFPTTASQWSNLPPNYWETFYAANCKTFLVDGKTVLTTGAASWEYFKNLYSRFEKVEREVRSGVVVTSRRDDEEGDDGDGVEDGGGGGGGGGGGAGREKYEYSIHVEFMTRLYTTSTTAAADNDKDVAVVEVPQSFVYVLGEAEGEGKGTLGLQIRELRNYYDLRTLEGAFLERKKKKKKGERG